MRAEVYDDYLPAGSYEHSGGQRTEATQVRRDGQCYGPMLLPVVSFRNSVSSVESIAVVTTSGLRGGSWKRHSCCATTELTSSLSRSSL